MRVNVAHFSSKMPNKVSISNSTPRGLKMRSLRKLFPTLAAFVVPSWGLVDGYKKGKLSWEAYTRIYLENLNKIDLPAALKKLGKELGVDELTLCCWEAASEERCHRKLLYDSLPGDMRGMRA